MYKMMVLIFLTNLMVSFTCFASKFDQIDWKYAYEENGIQLFVNDSNTCFKAVTLLEDYNPEQVVSPIMDFSKYKKIFPKTLVFKPIKLIDKNHYLIYAVVNFFPMKNRHYIIELKYYQMNEKYIIEWYPPRQVYHYPRLNESKYIHSHDINGRWTIEKKEDKKILVSVEYNNDWKLKISKKVTIPFEKKETINAVIQLQNFLTQSD